MGGASRRWIESRAAARPSARAHPQVLSPRELLHPRAHPIRDRSSRVQQRSNAFIARLVIPAAIAPTFTRWRRRRRRACTPQQTGQASKNNTRRKMSTEHCAGHLHERVIIIPFFPLIRSPHPICVSYSPATFTNQERRPSPRGKGFYPER